MEACADLAEFVAAPVGRCFAGRSWLYFYPHRGLCGFCIWGRPDAEDLERLVRVLAVELGSPPHVSLVDARRLEAADPRGFDVLDAYVRAHGDELGRVVERLALVRPAEGLASAIAVGFFGVSRTPYPLRVFEARPDALAWLGVEAELDGVLAREEARAAGSPPLLRDLRAWLDTHLAEPSLADAARALGASARTLQRKLGEHGASFQAEVSAARVRAAMRLLRDTDAPLTEIAFEIGCASPASFSTLFRRATGEAPSAWRDARRRR